MFGVGALLSTAAVLRGTLGNSRRLPIEFSVVDAEGLVGGVALAVSLIGDGALLSLGSS